MTDSLSSVRRRVVPSGLVVAALGFFLTRFTVTLAVSDTPVQFVLAGIVPLVLGLGLSAFGIALSVGTFDGAFVRTVTLWTLAGTGAMLVLVVLTLLGDDGMAAMASPGARTYLSNFLISGAVGGAFTGVYAGRAARQQHKLEQQAARLDMVNRILRDRVLNALTVIRGRVDVATNTADASERLLGAVDERADSVQQTIENMKHITYQGETSGSLDPVAVAPTVERGVAGVRSKYPDADYSLDVDGTEGIQVSANQLLENVVSHLVENAVVYNDASTPSVSVSLTATDERVFLTVADDGPGLPERQLRLLDRGEVGSYTDRSTGFGLDLVRLLVGSYGGTTSATVTDAGTTVTLALPRADRAGLVPIDETYGLSRRHLLVSTLAAVLAAAVMAVPMQYLAGNVPIIGALYGVANVWVGGITHVFHSIVFALVYATLVDVVPVTRGNLVRDYGVAAAWSLALWLVAAGIVMPLWLNALGIEAQFPNLTIAALAGHLLWGLSLASFYRYGRVWAERE